MNWEEKEEGRLGVELGGERGGGTKRRKMREDKEVNWEEKGNLFRKIKMDLMICA